MRKIFPALFLLLLLSACDLENKTDKAVEYNDFIIEQQDKINAGFESFIDAVDTGDSVASIKALDDAFQAAKESERIVREMEPLEGGEAFRDAAADLYAFYAKSLDEDYRSILPILVSDSASLEALERSDAVIDQFSQQEDEYHSRLASLQKSFAEKYNFILQ